MQTEIKTKGAIYAHWKGFRSIKQAAGFLQKIAHYHGDRHIYLALPLHHLAKIQKLLVLPSMTLGISGIPDVDPESFSGPVALDIVKDCGAQFALLGDQDRRGSTKATEGKLAEQIRACLNSGITPFLSLGETLDEYKRGKTEDVLIGQISLATSGLTDQEKEKIHYIQETSWRFAKADQISKQEIRSCTYTLRKALFSALGPIGKTVHCASAIPPYMNRLDTLPNGSENTGYLVTKAAVVPKSLVTIAPKESYRPTEETKQMIQEAQSLQALPTPTTQKPPPSLKQSMPSHSTKTKKKRAREYHRVEDLSDLFA